MPLAVHNLDDRDYDQLVTEARGMIPRYFPKWTDHNPTDPGVTLMELFAFLIEAKIYQINQIPERSLEKFAQLIGIEKQADETIETTLGRALLSLSAINRAITIADFETLIKNEFLINKNIFSCRPTLFRKHEAGEPVVMMQTSVIYGSLYRSVAAGETELTLFGEANVAPRDVIMIDDGQKIEFVKIKSILYANGTMAVSLYAPLRFGHLAGTRLLKILQPIPNTKSILLETAGIGSKIVKIKPMQKSVAPGVLRLGTGIRQEYVWIQSIARVKAVTEVVPSENTFPDYNLKVNVMILPDDPENPEPVPDKELCQAVFEFLRSDRLITARVQVIKPEYTDLYLEIVAVRDMKSRLTSDVIRQTIVSKIQDFLSPLKGGKNSTGWEFGRSVYRSELYQIIEGIPGVHHVKHLLLNGDVTKNEISVALLNLVNLKELKVEVLDS